MRLIRIARAKNIVYNEKQQYEGNLDSGEKNAMNINWEYLFSNMILKRGEDYFRAGKVLAQRGNQGRDTKVFYVYGTKPYVVKITRGDASISSLQCSCPHAQDGRRCKHMAAALFKMEADGELKIRAAKKADKTSRAGVKPQKVKKAPPVRVFPFRAETAGENGEKPYRFYDLDKAAAPYPIYEQDLRDAQTLIEQHKIELDSVQEGFRRGYYGEMERQCAIYGNYTVIGEKTRPVGILFSKDKILDTDCGVPDCPQYADAYQYYFYGANKRSLCTHTLALLLLAQDYIAKEHIGDATDYNGVRLLRECRAKRAANRRMEAAEETAKGQIHLEPRLDVEADGSLHLAFRVGREKLYVVKNLTELVDTVESHGEMQLGTKHVLSFASDRLDDEDQRLYRFMKKEVKSTEMRNAELQQRYGQEFGSLKASIPLYGRTLDEFYTLMEAKRFPFTDRSQGSKRSGEAGCVRKSPKIKLCMVRRSDASGSFEGIELNGRLPKLVNGTDHIYFFDGENLSRADDENLELLDSLRDRRYDDEVSLVIGRRNLSEFYYRMLPILKEFAEIEIKDADEIEKYLYPEAEFSFFLDVEDGMLSCEAKVRYGENTTVPAGAKMANLQGAQPREETQHAAKDEAYEEYRDLNLERETMERVLEYFPYGDGSGVLYSGETEEGQYQVLETGVDTLLGLGEVHATDRFQRLTIRRKPQMTVGVRMESDLLKLTLSSTDLTEDELLDILGSYQRTKKYHRLKNGDFVQLDENTLEELETLMDLTKADPKDFVKGDMEIPAYRALYLDKVLEKNEAFYAKRDQNFKHLVKEFKTVSDSEYEIPESLQGVMRNYQEFGYKWLRTIEAYRFGGILADDMGLGKTLQVISVLLASKEDGRLGTAMVVTPASLVYNWKEEFAKFAPQLSVAVIAGSKGEREEQIRAAECADVVITSYDLLKRDILFYADQSFEYQIIDEAQSIKTHTTAAAKAVKAVRSKIRFALTGTPIENRLSELWSIFDFLMPGFLYSYDRFRKELELPIAKHQDPAAMTRLKRFVEPFILRRLKQDVLSDLPEKNEEVCYVHFEQKQQRLYDAQVVHMRKMLEEQSEETFQKSKIALLAEITKIRQICCDPALCFHDYDGESAKRDACMELLRNAVDGGHKILVFSQFRSLLERLEQDLQRENLAYFKITGETKKEERIEMVKRFNGDDTPVFLISLKAGGTGLNLTGADIVIHLDPWWNIAAQDQATDRAHRIGQTKAVSVYKLIAKNTMEEKILKMQEAKRALADEILSGNTGGLMSMSRDELLELL